MLRNEIVRPLNRIDVTRYRVTDGRLRWLLHSGYTFRFDGRRVFLERAVGRA